MESPIFILGASRSGTTMLRLVLNAHSRIGIPKEMPYFGRVVRTGRLEAWANPGLSDAEYREFVRGFLQHRRVALQGIDLERLERDILAAGPPDFRRPFSMTLEAWGRHHGKVRLGEKTPRHFFFVDVLYEMFPDARFIHLVRDPRGAVYSMNRFMRFTDDTILNAFNWHLTVDVGRTLLQRAVPAAQQMTVRFEDLVASPEATVRALCAFLEEPFEAEMLAFYEQAERHMNPAFKRLGGVGTVTKPISRRTADKWREGFSQRDVALVEAVCGREMQLFGYERTGAPLRAGDRLELAAKLLYCRWQWRRQRKNRVHLVTYRPFARTRHWLRRFLPQRMKANHG